MEGNSGLEPLEHSVLDVNLDGRPMKDELNPEPLEHSVLDVNLDMRPMKGMLDLEPLEHSVPDRAPIGGANPFVRMSVSDPLEHSGLINSEDVVQKLVPLEPLEHSVPEGPQSRGDGLVSDMDSWVELRSACLPRVASDAQGVDIPLLDDRPPTDRSRTEPGEAIVVGAIGSAAPWFLTGWVHDVEVEFMIDTGCQVTILATTVFERMCTVDPRVRSKLRPCRRRLVSEDSSPLTVKGELELSVVFPGLCWLRGPASGVSAGWPSGGLDVDGVTFE